MSRAVVALAGAVLVLAGCAGSVAGEPAASSVDPSSSALAEVDMCTIVSEEELRSFGLRPETGRVEEGQGDLGCFWLGAPITMGMVRNLELVADDAFDREENVITIRENDLAARNGVLSQVDEASCNQQLDAGSGSVLIIVRADQGGDVDPCAEVVEIAELIAPRLPEVGS